MYLYVYMYMYMYMFISIYIYIYTVMSELAGNLAPFTRRLVFYLLGPLGFSNLPASPLLLLCSGGRNFVETRPRAVQATGTDMHHLSVPASIQGNKHTRSDFYWNSYANRYMYVGLYMALYTCRATQAVHISVRRLWLRSH